MIRGGGIAVERGILIRSGEGFETLKDIKRVVFNKNAYRRKPSATSVVPSDGDSEEDVLILAASAEAPSEHPLAQAIVDKAEEAGLSLKVQ